MKENTEQGPEMQHDAAELYQLGSQALEAKQYALAYRYLHSALTLERTPEHLSQYGLALAHERRDIRNAVSLCQEAIKNDPRNVEHFLRLGTVYLIGDQRKEAIRIFRLGLRVGKSPQISRWLQILGHRESPVIPFLARSNPINKYLGKIRTGLRKK